MSLSYQTLSPTFELVSPHRWQSRAIVRTPHPNPHTLLHLLFCMRKTQTWTLNTHQRFLHLSFLHSPLLYKHTPACKNSIYLKMESNGMWNMRQKKCFASAKSVARVQVWDEEWLWVLTRLSTPHKCLIVCVNNLCSNLIGHYKRKQCWQERSIPVKESGSDRGAYFAVSQQINDSASLSCNFYERQLHKKSWHPS